MVVLPHCHCVVADRTTGPRLQAIQPENLVVEPVRIVIPSWVREREHFPCELCCLLVPRQRNPLPYSLGELNLGDLLALYLALGFVLIGSIGCLDVVGEEPLKLIT